MNYTTPKSMNRTEVKSDFAKYERKYVDQTRTLSQFVDKQLVNLWDVAEISDAELLILKQNLSKKTSSALVILELKN